MYFASEIQTRICSLEIVWFVLQGFSTEVTLPLGDYEALGSETRQEFRSFRLYSRKS